MSAIASHVIPIVPTSNAIDLACRRERIASSASRDASSASQIIAAISFALEPMLLLLCLVLLGALRGVANALPELLSCLVAGHRPERHNHHQVRRRVFVIALEFFSERGSVGTFAMVDHAGEACPAPTPASHCPRSIVRSA